MLKVRCENCTRLIICQAVTEGAQTFCAEICRENWQRAMRRFQAERKPLVALGDA